GAVAPDDADRFTGGDGEADVLQGPEGVVAAAARAAEPARRRRQRVHEGLAQGAIRAAPAQAVLLADAARFDDRSRHYTRSAKVRSMRRKYMKPSAPATMVSASARPSRPHGSGVPKSAARKPSTIAAIG